MTGWKTSPPTALLLLADGTKIWGTGLGAAGSAVGEVCFNTAMTGYQEILTDPSYAGQIITFTFPHIGNVGTNDADNETIDPNSRAGVRGALLRADVTEPANYRATQKLDAWFKARNIVAMAGFDTRALTALIRETGMPNGIVAFAPDGKFDLDALAEKLAAFPGLEGLDLAATVTIEKSFSWDETSWGWDEGFGRQQNPQFHIVAMDFGAKRNILRRLADKGARVTVVPASASAEEILALAPDGIFLSNGPGDPAATGKYAVPTIRKLLDADLPLFGICLGHQLLALALGGNTSKMHQGHHGANHPVKDLTTGKVEITSMNHGFAVDGKTLPEGVTQTHISLFDGSNCGLSLAGKPVFSVQYHPEASPGPHDAHYLFTRFINLVRERQGLPVEPEAKIASSLAS